MKKNKGITLIALVITIIVLLILAGVAIAMLSGENGILKKAAEAKTKTDEAQTNETGDLQELEYIIKKNTGKIKWTYKKDGKGRETIVTNGKYKLSVGTYINYDPTKDKDGSEIEKNITSNIGGPIDTENYKANEKTITEGNGASNQTFSNKATTNGWRILGIDETTGELLIISADPIKTIENKNYILRGIAGYTYGETELDKVCSVFGSGYGATGARSVDVDDINKITGYNPNNVGKYDSEQKTAGTKFGMGEAYEYANDVTYSWTEITNQVSWAGSNTKNGTWLNSNYATYGFNWYDTTSKTWKNLMQDTTTPAAIVTLTGNYYYYYPDSLNISSGTGEGLNKTSEEYKTLFMNKSGSKIIYWLASSYINTNSDNVSFGMRHIYSDGSISYNSLYYSTGGVTGPSSGVRPVVSLKAEIELKEGTDGSYDIVK